MLALALVCFIHLTSAEQPWWRAGILYQVYPLSFLDSNGDGAGDIKGIISKVPYLKNIGVDYIWLSPIFASPLKDNGYDIANFRAINPLFGTMADVDALIKTVHEKGMRILLDFVPNHTSDQHPWFNASRYRIDGKEDFYMWVNPRGWKNKKPVPPNNWRSRMDGGAWEYDEVRGQFYLHQFTKSQPDLNLTNPKVVNEMKKLMRFWLDKGVDGLRMDASGYVAEDKMLRDEPVICDDPVAEKCLDHIYTRNVAESYDVAAAFDSVLIDYETTNPKFFFHEVYASLDKTMKYFMNHSACFNFNLILHFTADTNAKGLKEVIDTYMGQLKKDMWPNWVTGNHDRPRVANRLGIEMIDVVNMIALMLPGITNTFQGEEIGMTDLLLRKDEVLDPIGRDASRGPMQWDSTRNAGFSRAHKTRLPVNTNYWELNVNTQWNVENSHLNTYKRLAIAKKKFNESKYVLTTTYGDWVFGLKRAVRNKQYYVIANLNDIEETVVLNKMFKNLPRTLCVHTPSINSIYKKGNKLLTSSVVTLRPKSALGLSNNV